MFGVSAQHVARKSPFELPDIVAYIFTGATLTGIVAVCLVPANTVVGYVENHPWVAGMSLFAVSYAAGVFANGVGRGARELFVRWIPDGQHAEYVRWRDSIPIDVRRGVQVNLLPVAPHAAGESLLLWHGYVGTVLAERLFPRTLALHNRQLAVFNVFVSLQGLFIIGAIALVTGGVLRFVHYVQGSWLPYILVAALSVALLPIVEYTIRRLNYVIATKTLTLAIAVATERRGKIDE